MVFNRDSDGNGITGSITNFIGDDRVKYFAAGLVAAYAIKKFSETETAHNLAVNLTAGALELRDTVEESIENIREDAEDIHAEAQEKQQIEIFGPEDLEDIDEEIAEELEIKDDE
ncbi:DUF6110 family protein [Methanosphaera sp.]|uniref:DUF6110 family protein n=1 Tax=Methanosphaera sp. TaxID=2666342 RepID=UPI0025E909A6|nr:DUF6110 family protein [Methanosphaera sp.]